MESFRKKILHCKTICNEELKKRKTGVLGEATTEQLYVIIREMDNILQMLTTNSLPLRNERFLLSFANAFTVWGWNMNQPTEIFLSLTQINQEYKEL